MKKILVVEDDNFLLNAYRVKFSKSGFEVKTATDGQEALKILKTEKFDIILLDLVMPIKDGFSTLKDIKADTSLANIPVIIASNLGQKEDIAKSMELGAADFVIKSNLSIEELLTKVNSFVK